MKRQDLIDKTNSLGKDVFTARDIHLLFPDETNARVAIKRLIDANVITAIAQGIYTQKNTTIESEVLATQLYYPSYISFETALSKYGIINQGFNKITLATSRHSKRITVVHLDYEYIQIKSNLFFGFKLIGKTYLADAEKAYLDELYLISLGKRKINYHEWTLDHLNKPLVKKYLRKYPPSTSQLVGATLGI